MLSARAPSRNDIAQPASVFAKLELKDVLYGTLSLLASLQYLDARAEYQSYGALTHDTRITELNQNYRLSYEVTPVERLTLNASADYFNSAPTSGSHINVGRKDFGIGMKQTTFTYFYHSVASTGSTNCFGQPRAACGR